MRGARAFLQASPACTGASPLPRGGVGVRGAPPGAWAWFGLGLSPEPAGSKSHCDPGIPPCFAHVQGIQLPSALFPAPTSPGTHPCCASQKALSSQRWLPATSMFAGGSGCITCGWALDPGSVGRGVAPWAVTHSCSPARCLSVRTSVPRKHVVELSWSRAWPERWDSPGAPSLAVACSTQPLSLSCTQGWRGCPWMCRPWWTSRTK